MKSVVRIGTRGSKLALYQTELVKAKLGRNFPLLQFEVVTLKTSGDMIRRSSLHPFETKRVYTKEIEEALERKEIDLAVHSAKDVAVKLPGGLKLGAILEREDPRDCLVTRDGKKLNELLPGARIGTSAIRRKLQLLRLHPELLVEEFHGNVDSRLRKLEAGETDGIVLAYAGLARLGLTARVSEIFSEEKFFPAPGQGAIVVESRSEDPEVEELVHPLNHPPSVVRVTCERAFLARLEGGCQLPCGVTTRLETNGAKLSAAGLLFSLDGTSVSEARIEGSSGDAEGVGRRLAEEVLAQGGEAIVRQIRKDYPS